MRKFKNTYFTKRQENHFDSLGLETIPEENDPRK